MRRGEQMANGKGTGTGSRAGVEVTLGVGRKTGPLQVLKPKELEKVGTMRPTWVQCAHEVQTYGREAGMLGVREMRVVLDTARQGSAEEMPQAGM